MTQNVDWDAVLEAYPIGTAVGSGARATATPELRIAAGEAIVRFCEILEASLSSQGRSTEPMSDEPWAEVG